MSFGNTPVNLLILILPFLSLVQMNAQGSGSLRGKVTDENGKILVGATILISSGNYHTISDTAGSFLFKSLPKGKLSIEVSHVGYNKFTDSIEVNGENFITVRLHPALESLSEVVITGQYADIRKKQEPLSLEAVNHQYLRQNLGGSLMESLQRLPGVSTMEIGSGQSKPVIRGLGFNRVVVMENGIKHEAQQWGEDHGLEIDQYAARQIEVIKGPSSLLYGSDAISGIILVQTDDIPLKNTIAGSIDITGRSNNNRIGMSTLLIARRKSIYMSARLTAIGYGDYIIPTDSVDIYSYRVALPKHALRNTAGKEADFHITAGYIKENFKGRIILSSFNAKSGFFANAHGLEPRNVDTKLHDHSNRDILYPWQEVHHVKVIFSGEFSREITRWETVLGFQNNLRREWSQYVSHGFMPARFPENMPFQSDLERQFDKNAVTGRTTLYYSINNCWSIVGGLNGEVQDNKVSGWSMIIPSFQQTTLGGFLITKGNLSKRIKFTGGLRYDAGILNTRAYYDWFPTPVVSVSGDTSYHYLQRAPHMSQSFSNITGGIGMVAGNEYLQFKINLGKGFRMPLAQELSSNGINYHHFSFEKGDTSLRPEASWQADLGLVLSLKRFAIEIAPFINYFPNFIFLNPTFRHDYLYGAGNQVFEYTQAKVFRTGGEVHLHIAFSKYLKGGLIAEYVYSEQLSGPKKGFCLPFAPPASFLLNMRITPNNKGLFQDNYISADAIFSTSRKNILPPEIPTPGYFLLNLSAGTSLVIDKFHAEANFQIQNILNQKYFNHTSYYRKIGVPEPGRNLSLTIHIPVNK